MEDVTDYMKNHSKDELENLINSAPIITDPEQLHPILYEKNNISLKHVANFESPKYDQTDLDRAKWFIHNYGNLILYNHSIGKFHVWDEKRWKIDDKERIYEFVTDGIKQLYEKAANTNDDRERIRLIDYARKLENHRMVNEMLKWVQSIQPKIKVVAEDLNRNPMLINLQNGTYDLETFVLREACQDDYISKIANIEFDEEAKCPKWLEFLDTIFQGNENLIRFLQRAYGYTLTGKKGEQVLFILYGRGKNGKSTFLKTLQLMLNDYAKSTSFKTFLRQKNDFGPRSDIVRLAGARLVTAIEPDAGRWLSDSTIKILTGGDIIAERTLYKAEIEFDPVLKLWLACNHKPGVTGTDEAMWRRLKLIPFTHEIPENRRIKDFEQILIKEAGGIFNWGLEGLMEYNELGGLAFPEEVEEATKVYRDEMDIIGRFIDECCVLDAAARSNLKELYAEFTNWNEDEQEITSRKFAELLKEKEFRPSRSGRKRFWKGIKLKDMFNGDA
jgi:putative DNA primase/helicase